jgi:hypothetical protein
MPDPSILTAIDLRNDGKARAAQSRPVPVQVQFAKSDGRLATRDGMVRYAKGDALLTGFAGDSWPVARHAFLDRYQAQAGTDPGEDGRYLKRPLPVLVRQLDAPVSVAVGAAGDLIQGLPGDWLVQYAPGEHGIVGQGIFEATYVLDPPRGDRVQTIEVLQNPDHHQRKD